MCTSGISRRRARRRAFDVAAHIPNATLDDFRLDHLDIEAATAGTIADAKNWTLTDNNIKHRRMEASRCFTDGMVQDPRDVPYGEPK
jgi:hypothetical protein